MPIQRSDNIHYYVFDSFVEAGVTHGAITRRGGVSPQPWSSLNVGATVGDDLSRVARNRELTFRAFDRPLESLYDVWQVHSRKVVSTKAPRNPDQPHIQADAILTDRPGVTLFMRFADCVPIFLYDPIRGVVGLVHAGWQGTVKKIVYYAIQAMMGDYGCRPEDILSGIGPSIGPHHYEVGPEVALQVQQAFGQDASGLLISRNGDQTPRMQFDLWSANQLALEQAGIRNIEIAQICTACCTEDWYSHRAENGSTGRFGALIAL